MNILDTVNKYKIPILYTIITLLCISLIIFIINNNNLSRDKRFLENNIIALNDTLHRAELRNESILYSKNALILEKKEIEKYLDISKKEVKEIEKELDSKIQLISEISSTILIDTITVVDSIYITHDSIYTKFKYDDNWFKFNGDVSVLDEMCNLRLYDVSVNTDLTVGLTDDNKVFATSSNPYLKINNIKSALTIKSTCKPKRCNLGLQVGVGAGYDVIHKDISVGPYIGLGFSYGFSF